MTYDDHLTETVNSMPVCVDKVEARQRLAYLCRVSRSLGMSFDEWASNKAVFKYACEIGIEDELDHYIYFYRT